MRAWIARRLEEGAFDGPMTRALSSLYAPVAARALARPLALPPGVAVVAVGGATLGGSGKTRVAVACARELARRREGARVVLVGHAYRGAIRRARVVTPDDALAEVGDEALACARALAGLARVVVGPTRQGAVDLAARLGATAIVLDGPCSTRPARPHLTLLAVDARAPFGSGEVAPSGDLRARPAALRALADHVVPVDAAPRGVLAPEPEEGALPLASLAGRRVGLFTALARPSRLRSALARAGVAPRAWVHVADHGPLTRAAAQELVGARASVDLWLATPKCAAHLAALELGRPVLTLDPAVELPAPVRAALAGLPLRLARLRPGPTSCLDPLQNSALVSMRARATRE